MIKVLLVDREGISSEGLRLIIEREREMKWVGTYFQKEEVIHAVQEKQPDIVVFHIHQSYHTVIELTKEIKSISKQIKIIYILSFIEPTFITNSIKAGVEGYFLSHSDHSNFVSMIKNIYHNHYVITEDVAVTILQQFQKGDEKQRLHAKLLEKEIDLTWRELDIAFLIYQRKKNKEIAQSLHLKEKTVRDYVSIIYKKLGVNKRLLVINFLENLIAEEQDDALQ
ncbi:hypothetical protein CAI16_12860 [Virgibacillus dokdonensis]|uniref:Uncharacterized protein n=1 Tax=Virgibacillus dokdonensis TaxID=302167 RepID=A0A3E0WPX2_9BACI|nr:response regulator transcription factor [Virgibacillus dokdonensis]RFA34015.1 hypothetical protein CAI16_12860 [Virgibacillus dokdonensis]